MEPNGVKERSRQLNISSSNLLIEYAKKLDLNTSSGSFWSLFGVKLVILLPQIYKLAYFYQYLEYFCGFFNICYFLYDRTNIMYQKTELYLILGSFYGHFMVILPLKIQKCSQNFLPTSFTIYRPIHTRQMQET